MSLPTMLNAPLYASHGLAALYVGFFERHKQNITKSTKLAVMLLICYSKSEKATVYLTIHISCLFHTYAVTDLAIATPIMLSMSLLKINILC